MQQTMTIGQAQPTVLQQLEARVKSEKERLDKAVEDSEFCKAMGLTPWHFTLNGVLVSATVCLALLMICMVAEWLEGGAL